MENKRCEDYCPNCNSTNIEWGLILIRDVMYQPATCLVCGMEFREYYEYAETEWQPFQEKNDEEDSANG